MTKGKYFLIFHPNSVLVLQYDSASQAAQAKLSFSKRLEAFPCATLLPVFGVFIGCYALPIWLGIDNFGSAIVQAEAEAEVEAELLERPLTSAIVQSN
jgi:hypothetical protein